MSLAIRLFERFFQDIISHGCARVRVYSKCGLDTNSLASHNSFASTLEALPGRILTCVVTFREPCLQSNEVL